MSVFKSLRIFIERVYTLMGMVCSLCVAKYTHTNWRVLHSKGMGESLDSMSTPMVFLI